MRVGILQFAPQLRKVNENIERANALLSDVNPRDLDLLVLPELAFSGTPLHLQVSRLDALLINPTGYNFPNLAAIKPYLEPTAGGATASWARTTAARLQCMVSVGYPEVYSATEHEPGSISTSDGEPNGASIPTNAGSNRRSKRYYNATLTVDPSGGVVAHYRKTNLYYTDASWSWPNPDGFQTVSLNLPSSVPSITKSLPPASDPGVSGYSSTSIPTAFAICMDFNPKQFLAPWSDYEIATHVVRTNAKLLIASNAWLTHKSREELLAGPAEHDPDTLSYWLSRLRPLLDEGGGWNNRGGDGNVDGESAGGEADERIIIIANRVGIEPGVCRACDLTRGCPPDDSEADSEEDVVKAAENEAQTGSAGDAGEPTVRAPADDVVPGSGIVAMEARYAGSSCVMGLRGDGRIRMYGLLGCAEEKLLVVDTHGTPDFVGRLVGRAERDANDSDTQ